MNNEIRTDWVGQIVGARFRLLRWVGGAGRSQVFSCRIEDNPEQKTAIKLFPADAEGAQACAAGWAAALTLFHPHLMRVLYTGQDRIEDTRVLYVVTEYAGEVLSEILPDRPLTPEETKEMLGPVLDALVYLHGKGLVHGRIKPSNIMVVDDQVKLSEENIRGSAGAVPPPASLDIYDAPERAQGKVLPASDLWSLGITLVEALTQIPPIWNRAGGSEPIVPPSVPRPFAQIARECLRVDPAMRGTVAVVKMCLDTGASLPHRTPGPVEGLPRDRRKLVIGAAAAVLLAVFGMVMLRSHHETPSQDEEQTETTAPAATQPPAVRESPSLKQRTPPKTKAAKNQTPPLAAQTGSPAVSAASPHQQSLAALPLPSVPRSQAPPAPQRASGPVSKGAVAQQILPQVSAKANATIRGTIHVAIRIQVDANGSVSDAAIESQGPSKYFADLALQSARSFRFTPAQVNGQGAPSVWLLHYLFRQSGVEVTPAEQTP